jgi:hypothetical protein
MVSVRDLERFLGVAVHTNNASRELMLSLGSANIRVTPGVTAAKANGRAVHLAAAPYIVNGVTYVPAKAVASALGIKTSRACGSLSLRTPDSRMMLLIREDEMKPLPTLGEAAPTSRRIEPKPDKAPAPLSGKPAPPKLNQKPA